MAITGHACNGWAFWSLEKVEGAPSAQVQQTQPQEGNSGETAGTTGAQETTPAGTEEQQERRSANKRFFRTPNQRGVPEGQTRWYCHNCSKSFLVTTGQMPESCPAGHKA
jgi:hypothetical protein